MSIEVKKDPETGFYLFPGTTFIDPLKSPHSCYDTVESKCYFNKSLEECVKICDDHPDCGAGFHITSNKESICAPLKTSLFPDSNPAYKIVMGDNANLKYTSFINSKNFEFPPDDAGAVYFGDVLQLKCEDNQTFLSTTDRDEPINFEAGSITRISFLNPNMFFNVPFLDRVNYGDPVIIVQDKSSLIIQEDDQGTDALKWLLRLTTTFEENQAFFLVNANGKNIGDPVVYGDNFYIYRSAKMSGVVLDKNNNLINYGPGPEEGKYKGYMTTFSLQRSSPIHACINGECLSVDRNQVVYDGISGKYNGEPVYRSENCFLKCGTKEGLGKITTSNVETPKKSSPMRIKILLGICILAIIFLVYRLK